MLVGNMPWFKREAAVAAPTVSAPVITSIVFDKPGYTPGQIITATVNYAPGVSSQAQTFSGTATDAVTGQQGTLSVSFTVNTNDTTNLTVSDSGNRAWTKVSDSGIVAVFTATA